VQKADEDIFMFVSVVSPVRDLKTDSSSSYLFQGVGMKWKSRDYQWMQLVSDQEAAGVRLTLALRLVSSATWPAHHPKVMLRHLMPAR